MLTQTLFDKFHFSPTIVQAYVVQIADIFTGNKIVT